ncbi:MAG TPA: hypothetical protein VIG89_04930 [Candidatus Acidoferrales bacterium]
MAGTPYRHTPEAIPLNTLSTPESAASSPMDPLGPAAPPCFFWSVCSQRAALEKAGRSVCRRCAAKLRGTEYPLRSPCAEPLYFTGRSAAEALDMLEHQPRPARRTHNFINPYTSPPEPDLPSTQSKMNGGDL